jgi:hypothetical protein
MIIGGKELKITLASFNEALNLQRAIGKELAQSNSKFDIDSLTDGKINDDSVLEFLKILINIGISKEIEDCIFICAERAMWGTEKVDREFFEKEENRQYYFEIMFEIAKVNISPFFRSLLSRFSGLQGMIGNILKQKSK